MANCRCLRRAVRPPLGDTEAHAVLQLIIFAIVSNHKVFFSGQEEKHRVRERERERDESFPQLSVPLFCSFGFENQS